MQDFHPLIAEWFRGRFAAATPPQREAWPRIRAGRDVLVSAPTGSGKTLAAFLICLDRLVAVGLEGRLDDRIDVVYVSPLKALSNDIGKNLETPLAEIETMAASQGLPNPGVRTAVRTGDTSAWERERMIRRPPHILVTTPESLFILLTAERGREALRRTSTVIVDEIHALVDDKRGSHLALTLARLEDLVLTAGGARPQRIGLSATVRPIEDVASFLHGSGTEEPLKPEARSLKPTIAVIDSGHRRQLDLAVEVPRDELGVVASNEMWVEIYDRLSELVLAHRTTLVFVNTRRLCERVAHHLAERLGDEAVLAHHGSLSRRLRQTAESQLKAGRLRAVVATASLELGIDIGTVDLVCQIGSPRSIAVTLQRVGRSGHQVDTPDDPHVPTGRLFATTRDELVECAALVRAIRKGRLDRLAIPVWPVDVLAQQLVAACACETWRVDDLFDLVRRAAPYATLPRAAFDAVVDMLADGITTSRGRRGAYLHHDRVNGTLRGRRGARLAAITGGGAIPDNANYLVVAEPDQTTVGTVDEDFAVESMSGDIFLLGTTSWRIRRVESGRLRVEDARGAAPSLPFWRGEAPGRTSELSEEVSRLRDEIAEALSPAPETGPSIDGETRALEVLTEGCGLDLAGAEQVVAYVRAGVAALGALPTERCVVAERFFDEAGGMQLIVHAPFGARVNRAWGLALRKRFCRSFNFELQAAATDNGIVISLAEQHSFPLEAIFQFLTVETVAAVLTQAMLPSPMFGARWRWNASRALAVLRFAGGRKVPPPIQRMRSDDLLASVFPDQVACQENLTGDIRIPDHPLVNETIRDCLHEAMDLDGLRAVLAGIERGEIRTHAIDTAEPSPFCHEILNANPYAFLDDAPLEERRARAVQLRRTHQADLGEIGALDAKAIATVADESWPVVRDADELHDALLTLVALPPVAEWTVWFGTLVGERRAGELVVGDTRLWVPTEHLELVRCLYPGATVAPPLPEIGQPRPEGRDAAVTELLRGWLESTGPETSAALAARLALPGGQVDAGLARLEGEGQVLRGTFTGAGGGEVVGVEWCNRRVLARIHRLTLGQLRREIEPVSSADFVRFLYRWQHLAPGTTLHGTDGLLQILKQFQGYEISGARLERDVLARRMSRYEPEMLDRLCLSGEVMWGRLSPHPAFESPASMAPSSTPAVSVGEGQPSGTVAARAKRVRPTRVAPVTLFLREDAEWLLACAARPVIGRDAAALSHVAREVLDALTTRGASFLAGIVRATGRLPSEVEDGLWELVAAGLVTADGFDNLRALVDPKRRRGEGRGRAARPRHAAGRWAPLEEIDLAQAAEETVDDGGGPSRHDAAVARFAEQLLDRWGVVFRDLLARETLAPRWRELLMVLRRMEARGEIRGGRFVAGFVGEQFARPEAVDLLRVVRREGPLAHPVSVPAADPLNLAGIVLPGPRVSALSGGSVDLLPGDAGPSVAAGVQSA
ncbi:MAG TPA: DEAD/DEAH box helicase [Vicinamibacterales bacterium]|nr:DEAD/DEAH box helicase [Vicinamibacterales bacterium]